MTKFITKDQIRKGDTIRVTFEPFKGIVLTREGTAWGEDDDGDWYALTDEEVSFPDFLTFIGGRTIDTIELLERPLPTEPGTVFSATQISGIACDVKVFVREGLFNGLNYVTSKLVGGDTSFTASHIEVWEPLDG